MGLGSAAICALTAAMLAALELTHCKPAPLATASISPRGKEKLPIFGMLAVAVVVEVGAGVAATGAGPGAATGVGKGEATGARITRSLATNSVALCADSVLATGLF